MRPFSRICIRMRHYSLVDSYVFTPNRVKIQAVLPPTPFAPVPRGTPSAALATQE
jgi:hypothetical protein